VLAADNKQTTAAAERGAALAFDIKRLTGEFLDDPYPTYRALREFDPVRRMPDGSYFLTRYDDCLSVYQGTATWSSDKKVDFQLNMSDSLLYEHHTTSLVFNDPPYHTRVRRLLAPAFAPRALRALQTRIEDLVDRLLAAAAERAEIDLIADFAAAIPIQLIGDMLGIPPGERKPLRGWSLAILGGLEPVLSKDQFDGGVRAVAEFKDYLDDIIAQRLRSEESDPAEILSKLIAGTDVGSGEGGSDRLSKLELIHNCIFLLNAGHETTTNLIGNAVDLLIRHPDAMADLRAHPEAIETAVEEFLRMESSNQLGAPSKRRRSAESHLQPELTCTSALAPPTVTRRNFPIPTASISAARLIAISPSAPAFTPAPACRWREWRHRSRSAGCWRALRGSSRREPSCAAAARAFAVSNLTR